MESVVGIFTSRDSARRAAREVQLTGVREDQINFLVPGSEQEIHREVQEVPTTETEQPGIGKALGGVVGGVLGASVGLQVAAAFLPGVGPVTAIGAAAILILTGAGVAGGAAAGEALEHTAYGVPADELFIYEDALRKGRTVLIVLADDAMQAQEIRDILRKNEAETIDVARENWWIGIRGDEELEYKTQGKEFSRDEANYRLGFEASLQPQIRGKSYDQALNFLRRRYPENYREEAFRRGFERGRVHYESLTETARK